MQETINFVEYFNQMVAIVPKWMWEIMAALALTLLVMQLFKMFQPLKWTPYKRRKINTWVSILVAGALMVWLYDQPYKDVAIVLVMLGYNFLYSGVAKVVEMRAAQHNGIWTVLHSFLRPHTRIEHVDGMVKEIDIDSGDTLIMIPDGSKKDE